MHTWDFQTAVLWITPEQYNFILKHRGAGGILESYNQLARKTTADIVEPSSVWPPWEQRTKAQPSGLNLINQEGSFWLQGRQPHLATGPVSPTGQTAGALASPLLPIHPQAGSTSGTLTASIQPQVQMTPKLGGSMWQLVWMLVRQGASASSGFLGSGSLLTRIVAIIGGVAIADFIGDRVGISSDESELPSKFLEALASMEAEGLIHRWTSRPDQNGQPRAPRYFIMDMENIQGFYTNFHMSRSGLTKHDEKQDTYKRPRRARRSARKVN